MTAHTTCLCTGGLKIKCDLRSGSHALHIDISFGFVHKHRHCGVCFFLFLAATMDPLYRERGFNKQPKTIIRPQTQTSNPLLNIIAQGVKTPFQLPSITRMGIRRTYYTPRNEVIIPPATKLGGGILESPCPSVRLSVRLSVDARLGKMVSSA